MRAAAGRQAPELEGAPELLGFGVLPFGLLPLEPAMFGQLPWWRGAAVPDGAPPLVDGCVVAFGAADGSGLAAMTAAAPPTPRRPAARTAMTRPLRMPFTARGAGGA